MLLTDEEVTTRLNHPDNVVNVISNNQVEVRPIKGPTKKNGDDSIPQPVRELFARLSHISGETDKAIAQTFGVSQPTVSMYARGLIGNRVDTDIAEAANSGKEERNRKLDKAHDTALDLMVASMDKLTTRLDEVKAKDLSRVAKDMHSIVQGSNDKNSTVNNTQVILYAPRKKAEREYETIEA